MQKDDPKRRRHFKLRIKISKTDERPMSLDCRHQLHRPPLKTTRGISQDVNAYVYKIYDVTDKSQPKPNVKKDREREKRNLIVSIVSTAKRQL